jgi:hypothetical protein
MIMKLIHDDGHEIKEGDTVTTFRGDSVTVTGWEQTGRNRIYLRDSGGRDHESFAGVIHASLIDEDSTK